MSAFLETSVLVRYLVGTPAEMAERARRIIDGHEPLQVTDVVLVEAAYVLTSFYRIPRAAVVDHLIHLLQKHNIVTYGFDKGTVILALLLARPSGRVSFADALIWAAARQAGAAVVYSFDQHFPAEGVEVREG